MPNIKRAIKKNDQDKKKTVINDRLRSNLSKTYKKAQKAVKITVEELSNVYSVIDKAAKKGLIHDNKAARMKSNVTKSASKK